MKKLAISLVVLLGLLVAADFGAAAYAESQVSKELRGQLQTPEEPDVSIHGFPFLTQVVQGDYGDVEVTADGVQADQLEQLGVSGNLYHAKVDTQELINGTAQELNVDQVDGRVELKADDIGRLIDVPDLSITPVSDEQLAQADGESSNGSPAEGGTGEDETGVQLDGTMNIAGQENEVRVLAAMSLVDGQVRIEPRDLGLKNTAVGDLDLPDVFKNVMREQFATTLDPGDLPFEVTPTALNAKPGALVVAGTAENVTVDLQ